jgi:hypothetical protein
MQEGIQLHELLKKIKTLQEAWLRAEHVAFNFIKRRVQPLMARDNLEYQSQAMRTHRRCPEMKSVMMISLRGWVKSSRTCRRTRLVQTPITPQHIHQPRSVAVTEASKY